MYTVNLQTQLFSRCISYSVCCLKFISIVVETCLFLKVSVVLDVAENIWDVLSTEIEQPSSPILSSKQLDFNVSFSISHLYRYLLSL